MTVTSVRKTKQPTTQPQPAPSRSRKEAPLTESEAEADATKRHRVRRSLEDRIAELEGRANALRARKSAREAAEAQHVRRALTAFRSVSAAVMACATAQDLELRLALEKGLASIRVGLRARGVAIPSGARRARGRKSGDVERPEDFGEGVSGAGELDDLDGADGGDDEDSDEGDLEGDDAGDGAEAEQ
jgi:hypothetical protein